MLTDDQISEVWEGQIGAETRSLYFGDLASMYSTRKQWITGISFFLSSGAAATLIAKAPAVVPLSFSLIVAIVTAYAVAVNLDSKIRTMAKLHYAWTLIGNDYRRLWKRAYSDEAESELEDLQRREVEFSELATTDAPNDAKRLLRWQDQVHKMHRLETA
jgi:hypothetical protein